MSAVTIDPLGGYLSKCVSALHVGDPIFAAVARATYENPPQPPVEEPIPEPEPEPDVEEETSIEASPSGPTLEQVITIFSSIDLNADGKVSKEELSTELNKPDHALFKLLEDAGIESAFTVLFAVLEQIDADVDGKITMDEFAAALHATTAPTAGDVGLEEAAWDGPTVKVVFCRHGESEWNALNQFCGWFDAALSDNGKAEAKAGGVALKEQGYEFDACHSSVLQRANTTAVIILEELGATESVPIAKTWRLNERHYGGLTGLNKAETAEKYGEDQVKIWRRSFDVPPLAMEADHEYYKTIQEDERYADVPADELPNCEALKNCIERSLPYWQETIEPQLKEGKKLLVAAHGNSLRGIVKHLDSLTAEEIMGIDLPTGIPFEYELTLPDLKPVSSMKFIGDDETVAKAIAKVKKQGAAKKASIVVDADGDGEVSMEELKAVLETTANLDVDLV